MVLDLPPLSTPSIFHYVPRINNWSDHPSTIIDYAPIEKMVAMHRVVDIIQEGAVNNLRRGIFLVVTRVSFSISSCE